MGVDLGKNLASEPTGVWCIRDNKDFFIHCQQVYQVVGHFSATDMSETKYEKRENGYKIASTFLRAGADKVDIVLQIDKL